jgi:hypothetical protein
MMFFFIQLFFYAMQLVDGRGTDANARVIGLAVDQGIKQKYFSIFL